MKLGNIGEIPRILEVRPLEFQWENWAAPRSLVNSLGRIIHPCAQVWFIYSVSQKNPHP